MDANYYVTIYIWCFCDMKEEEYDETNDNDAFMVQLNKLPGIYI